VSPRPWAQEYHANPEQAEARGRRRMPARNIMLLAGWRFPGKPGVSESSRQVGSSKES